MPLAKAKKKTIKSNSNGKKYNKSKVSSSKNLISGRTTSDSDKKNAIPAELISVKEHKENLSQINPETGVSAMVLRQRSAKELQSDSKREQLFTNGKESKYQVCNRRQSSNHFLLQNLSYAIVNNELLPLQWFRILVLLIVTGLSFGTRYRLLSEPAHVW